MALVDFGWFAMPCHITYLTILSDHSPPADGNIDALSGLYQPTSMMTFEGTQVSGSEAIIAKFKTMGPVSHQMKEMDVQPSSSPNAILIFVTGAIKINGGNPLHFCQMFQLVSNSPGNYYIHNDVFRLNYGL